MIDALISLRLALKRMLSRIDTPLLLALVAVMIVSLLVQASARAPLHRLLNAWMLVLEQMPSGRAVRWSLDVDPVDLY